MPPEVGPPNSLSAEDTWKLILADEHWHDWQEGRISPVKWHQHLMRRLNLSLTYGGIPRDLE